MATRMPATMVEKAGRAEAGVDAGEAVREELVARHGEPDARLAVLADEDRRDHAQNGADENEEPHKVQFVAAGLERKALERVDNRARRRPAKW